MKAIGEFYNLDRCPVNIHRPGRIAIVVRLELEAVTKVLWLLAGVKYRGIDIVDQIECCDMDSWL